MDKIRLGRSNLMVTKVGFGGIPIQRDTEEVAVAVVKRCLELGINYYDTANGYSTSEERIGKAIAGHKREDLIIATKSASRKPEGVAEHLKLSLKHLNTDYIDLYQFHNVTDKAAMQAVLNPYGPMAVVKEAQKEGKIRHIGVTSHNWEIAMELVKSDLFETLMVPFNFITHEAEDKLLPLAREHDVGFIAMKPLNGGALDATVSLAFKFYFQYPDVVPIVGIEKPYEIDEIIKIMTGPKRVTRADLAEMERLRKAIGNRFCRRCDYCQPCTQHIPISVVMSSQTFFRRLPPEHILTGWIADALTKAQECAECGECESRCPYKLPIREMMKERVKQFQDFRKQYAHLVKEK